MHSGSPFDKNANSVNGDEYKQPSESTPIKKILIYHFLPEGTTRASVEGG